MAALGVDVLVSAPQKGWSGPPCAGLVMLSGRAYEACMASTSSSFGMDLKKWLGIMEAYLKGGHMYHCTMPTDALTRFRDIAKENFAHGLPELKAAQWEP